MANNFNDNAKDTLDEWIYFLKNSEVPQNYTAKGLKEAAEKLQIDKLSEADRKEYQRFKESRWIERDVLETAERKGALKQSVNFAKKLMQDNFKNEDVANYTGLSAEQIEILRAGGDLEHER